MKKRNEKNDNIILTMIDFFIEEMCDSGIATIEEITEMFNEGKENEFRKMVREYKKIQNVTRSKANKAVIRLKKENKHLLELQKDMDKQYEELELQNFDLREDIMIKKMSFPSEKIKDKTFFDLYDMPTYEELETENQELKEKLIIKNKYDFQDMIISSIRYALGRRTYITLSTVDFIKQYPEIINKRVKQVMLRDLENYFEDRKKWEYKDDECDYQVWLSLKVWLENIEV